MSTLLTLAAALLALPWSAPAFQDPSPAPLILGVVVVREIPIGEESSASLIQELHDFDDVPGLRVIEIPDLPSTTIATADILNSILVDTGDGKPQPGNKPLAWTTLAGGTSTLRLLLRDKPGVAIGTARIAGGARTERSTAAAVSSSGVTMSPIVSAGAVHVIHGDTSGNSSLMSVMVDGEQAAIIAARPGAVFWRVPKTLGPGAHPVTFVAGQGKRPVTLPMFVIALKMSADRLDLIRGQSTRMHVTVAGFETFPAANWQSGMPSADLVDMTRFQQRAPGVKLPKPSDSGLVVVVLENRSPAVIKMGKGNNIVLQLHQRDLAAGQFTYEDKLQSLQAGAFDIRGTVTAFLTPVAGSPAE